MSSSGESTGNRWFQLEKTIYHQRCLTGSNGLDWRSPSCWGWGREAGDWGLERGGCHSLWQKDSDSFWNHKRAFQVRGIQDSLRAMFNPHFGSTFRSHNNPTYFSRKLFRLINDIYALKENIIHRFSDIYTSRVTNLLQYSLNHSFYPRSEFLVCCCHQIPFFLRRGICLLLSLILHLRRGVLPHEFKTWFVWMKLHRIWNLDWTLQSFDPATALSH